MKELNLRQRHWLELLKDYELQIQCHQGNVNVVADALSMKSQRSLHLTNITQIILLKELKSMNV